VFVGLAGLYGLVTPLWEAPDEVDHFRYAAHVLSGGGLPIQRLGERSAAHQPPLYYLVAAAFAWPADLGDPSGAFRPDPEFVWSGGDHVSAGLHTTSETFPFRGQALAAHLMRLASAVLGALTVLFTVLIGRQVVPARPAVALLAGVLVAFNPQFLFVHGAINNDAAAGLAGALVAWSTVRAYRQPGRARAWLLVGACLGVGLLAKSTLVGLALVPGVLLVVLAVQPGGVRRAVAGAAAATAGGLLVGGWWLARNVVLTGDPTGYRLYREIWAVNLRTTPFALADLPRMLLAQVRSFFGVFGWMTVPAPDWLLAGAAAVFALGAVGALVGLAWGRDAALVLPLGFVAATEVTLLAVALDCNESCWQGRYLFPAAGSLAVVVAAGLTAWLPRTARPLVALAGAVAAVWVPFGVIAPAYDTVPLPKSAVRRIEYPLELTVGEAFQLEGYAVRADPGARTMVATLYWRSRAVADFDYSAFVHLLDERGQIVAQEDKPPGEGRGYPPRRWWPQDIVRDEHVLLVPPAAGDGPFRLRMGLYNWQTGQQLTVRAGTPGGDGFVVTDAPLTFPPVGHAAVGG
jgi:hypothetical protein